jgi:hypothetical protein
MRSPFWYSSALRQSAEPEAQVRSQRRQRQGAHAFFPLAAAVAHGREGNGACHFPSGFQYAVRYIRIRAARPNPSLKLSTNGRPPGPGRWYAVHFHRPGPGVLPLSPA